MISDFQFLLRPRNSYYWFRVLIIILSIFAQHICTSFYIISLRNFCKTWTSNPTPRPTTNPGNTLWPEKYLLLSIFLDAQSIIFSESMLCGSAAALRHSDAPFSIATAVFRTRVSSFFTVQRPQDSSRSYNVATTIAQTSLSVCSFEVTFERCTQRFFY